MSSLFSQDTRLHVGRPLKGGLEALHFTLHLGGGPGAQTPRGLTTFLELQKYVQKTKTTSSLDVQIMNIVI